MPVICVVLLAAICASSGCRKSTAVAAPSSVGGTSGIGNVADLTTAPGTVFQVTYTDNTVVIDAATTEKTFRGVSADGQLFVFDNSNEQIKKLAPGSVMLLQGLALKKVVAVEDNGEFVVVATAPASLTDAIKYGHIAWDLPVHFDGKSAKLQDALPRFFDSGNWVVEAATPETSGTAGDWKYTAKANPSPGKLDLDLNVTGSLEGLDVDVNGTGMIQNFNLAADMQISNGVMENFKYVAKNLQGEVNLSFVATKKGDGMLKRIDKKLPPMFEAPVIIGGIPFVIGPSAPAAASHSEAKACLDDVALNLQRTWELW